MTLCIAWRDVSGIVHLASDSCVTVATNSYTLAAVKITRIRCEIADDDAKPASGEGVKRIDLGMAFSGSHICAYVTKETLVEILGRLNHIQGTTELSMDKICKIAFYVYVKSSKSICSTSIGENGRCSLFIAGFCEHERRVRVFKFETNTQNIHAYTEILKSSEFDVELIGTGSNSPLLAQSIRSDPRRALKAVIEDPNQKDVDGSIQYGNFVDNDFQIFCEYKIQDSGAPSYMRAGIDINEIIEAQDFDDLFVSPLVWICPGQ